MEPVEDDNKNENDVLNANDVEFNVCIKGTDYSNIDLRAKASDTIITLKQKYQSMTGKSVACQRLIFRGSELNNNDKLSYCKITGNAVIHVAFRQESNSNIINNVFNPNQAAANGGNERRNLVNNQLQNRNARTLFGEINIDPSLFSVVTCCTAYSVICCFVPLISLPDIVTLIIVNDYAFNYSTDHMTRECVWTPGENINISILLNIGSFCSILIYLLFAIWLFWYLRLQNIIQTNNIQTEQLNLNGCRGFLANSKYMSGIWWVLNFSMFCVSLSGIRLYENTLSSRCRSAEIGILLIVWSVIHFLFSFCICFPLCCACFFDG